MQTKADSGTSIAIFFLGMGLTLIVAILVGLIIYCGLRKRNGGEVADSDTENQRSNTSANIVGRDSSMEQSVVNGAVVQGIAVLPPDSNQ